MVAHRVQFLSSPSGKEGEAADIPFEAAAVT